MTIHTQQSQAGFTLIELAIVMIIIGLLIGGILKGQELINSAQVTSTISQMRGIDTAVTTFRDKYGALPGDITDPTVKLPGCTAAPCSSAGNGNGQIFTNSAGAPPAAAGDEEAAAFTHMSAGNLISGIEADNTLSFGHALPAAKVGGGYWIDYTSDGAAAGASGLRVGHYLVLNGTPNNTAIGGNYGAVDPSQAATIDRKMDDGLPQAGDVRVTGTDCISSGDYNEANQATKCSMLIRIQG